MRILINKTKDNSISNTYKISKSFALLPKKCYDLDSKLDFIVWLEPIKIVYKNINGIWRFDHNLIN